MADSSSNKPHIPSPPSSPSAPPKIPEMFKETAIITKLWDLIYLLVIGISVSYGLFSRKIDRVHTSDDNIGENQSYLFGISHISSIFEDGNHGIRNSDGFDDKSWVEGSRVSEIGDGKKKQKKKLNQYYLGESLVVINDEKYVLEQLGTKQNLGSKSWDSAAGKSVIQDSDSDFRIWFQDNQIGKFRGLLPIKLEERFQETVSDSDSRTRFNRRSKSMKLGKHDGMFTAVANESRVLDFESVRSQSVGFGMPLPSKIKNLSEKEELRGVEGNNRYRKPYLNGETSFMESKPQDFDSALNGGFEEIVKDFGKIKVDDGTFDPRNNRQFVKSKSQSSSIGASSEMNVDISNSIPKPANIANNYRRGKSVRTNRSKEGVLESKGNTFQSQTDEGKSVRSNRSKEQVLESKVNTFQSQPDEGKSVRTNRPKEQVLESKVNTFQGQTDEGKSVRTNRPKEQVLESKVNTFQTQPDEGKSVRTNRSKEEVLESKVNTFQSQTDEGKSVRTNRSKEQIIESKVNTFQSQTDDNVEARSKLGVDEMNVADEWSDTEPHSGEVDRKAEEFIAKFREQIRLQKVASARKLNLL